MADLNDEWESFLNPNYDNDLNSNTLNSNSTNTMPECGNIHISTKTKITYLSINKLDIKDIYSYFCLKYTGLSLNSFPHLSKFVAYLGNSYIFCFNFFL